jgi:hypothetical protein
MSIIGIRPGLVSLEVADKSGKYGFYTRGKGVKSQAPHITAPTMSDVNLTAHGKAELTNGLPEVLIVAEGEPASCREYWLEKHRHG